MAARAFTMQELVAQSGVSVRLLRHWIRQKLVPRPIGRGRGARYDERHLIRARAVQHLRKSRVSIARIRVQLGSRTDEEVAALLPPQPRATTSEGLPPPPPAPTYPSSMWEMVPLMDGMVLMVNPARGQLLRRIADEIFRYYGTPQAASRPPLR
jgi:DNA-binding transcriptional MerR regulator